MGILKKIENEYIAKNLKKKQILYNVLLFVFLPILCIFGQLFLVLSVVDWKMLFVVIAIIPYIILAYLILRNYAYIIIAKHYSKILEKKDKPFIDIDELKDWNVYKERFLYNEVALINIQESYSMEFNIIRHNIKKLLR